MYQRFISLGIPLLCCLLASCHSYNGSGMDIKEGDLNDLLTASQNGITGVSPEQLGLKVETVSTELGVQEDVYRIGPNDVLNITVLNHEELSSVRDFNRGIVGTIVKKDGYIYVPVIGKVKAAGYTVEEFIDIYHEHLTHYIQTPEISIDVLEYKSQKFYVLGEVKEPGVFPVDGDTTLLEAIGMAKGVTETGNLERAYVVRNGALLPISLGDLLLRGDTSRNVYMQDKDLVFVPSGADQTVYVLGEVKKPGAIKIVGSRLSLGQALAEAGGPMSVEADERSIRVIRGSWQQPVIYTVSYEAILVYGDRVLLQPGDRIVVEPTGLTSATRYMQQILPFLLGAESATRTYMMVSQ